MRKRLLLLLVLLLILAGCSEKMPPTEPSGEIPGTSGPQESTGPAVQAHPLTESTGGAVETFAGGFAVGAQPGAHQQFVNGIAQMSKTNAADISNVIFR